MNRPFPWTMFHDDRIRRAYQSAERGAIGRLAAEWNVTSGAIRLRGIRIGAAVPRRPAGSMTVRWSRAEDRIVVANLHRGIGAVVDALRAAGHNRNRRAVVSHLHVMRLRGDLEPLNEILEDRDEYAPGHIAAGLGVTHRIVNCWIARGWLRARVCGTAGAKDRHAVKRQELRRFLIDHVAHWDHRKADRYWLVDLLADRRPFGRAESAAA